MNAVSRETFFCVCNNSLIIYLIRSICQSRGNGDEKLALNEIAYFEEKCQTLDCLPLAVCVGAAEIYRILWAAQTKAENERKKWEKSTENNNNWDDDEEEWKVPNNSS